MSVEEEIIQLKAEIADYRRMLETATSEGRKDRLFDLITASRQNLHDLNIERQQQQGQVIDCMIDFHSRITI